MGESTFVNSNNNTPMAHSKTPRSLHLSLDVPLMAAVISLIVIGLLFVYSSSWWYAQVSGELPSFLVTKQFGYAILGLLVAATLSFIDYHLYERFLLPLMAVTFLLLIAVLVIGDARFGAVRTILNGSIQPSELGKLSVVIYLSFWLYNKRDVLNEISFGLLPMSIIIGITGGLIMGQPDISAAATVVVLGGLLFFLAGGDLRQIILVVVVSILIGWLIYNVSDTANRRMTDYVAGLQNPENASYHVQRSLEAVIRGGVFGVGIGKGSVKLTGLPVAWNDSIFAVIAEETGLVGCFAIVSLYMIILWRGLKIANRAPDLLGKLLASGLTIWIVIEALINMGVIVNLIPFAGNALPFISAGGSSLVMTLVGVGILLNIARSGNAEKQEGRSFGAVVNLRRGDGRGRVSRTVHSASSRD
jgi:cell division protein FtsW